VGRSRIFFSSPAFAISARRSPLRVRKAAIRTRRDRAASAALAAVATSDADRAVRATLRPKLSGALATLLEKRGRVVFNPAAKKGIETIL
jgi:hypothetical protein